MGDVKVLKGIRRSYVRAAAGCSQRAKMIVQATSEVIAARRRRRRSVVAKLVGQFRRLA